MDKNLYRKIALLIFFLLILITAGIFFNIQKFDRSKSTAITADTTNAQELSLQFLEFKKNKLALLNTETTASFIAVGDISFSRGVERVVKYQKNINFPFLKTKEILSNADITYANLETPITYGPEVPDGSMIFRSNPGTELALKWAGIDVVNLANNHSYNFDKEGLRDTFKFLRDADIQYAGAGDNSTQAYTPVLIQKNGIKFALLSYESMDIVPNEYEAEENKPGIAFMRIDKMQESVKKAKTLADVVIVAMHAGEEYVPLGNDLQTNFAHAAIDAGAEVVIGDHPHVIQNAEVYKEKIIFYNLGNFVMDQMWSDDTRRALIFEGIFTKKGLEKFYVTPVQIEHYSQPNPVTGELADTIVNRLQLSMQKEYTVDYDKILESYVKTPKFAYTTVLGNTTKDRTPSEKNIITNLDKDTDYENILLKNGQVQIISGKQLLWTSPENWWVDDVIVEKSLNDERTLVNMSVWKEGNFGKSKPLWETEDDNSIKNHMFVFALENKMLKHIWQSSNLPVPNCKIEFRDIEGDGSVELIAYEGDYQNAPLCTAAHIAVFRWKEWGFYNQWRESIN
ncbi:CapA family protein [candidate division WWE3 bacterium]|uniref:CapA family protein n=1 Tax=candidate division WWE3 bacterium TaxID=2053526 RepID=A0A7X9HHB2_UNCKA|nr:CapA family protein [candidate division WWE3 bacterium]